MNVDLDHKALAYPASGLSDNGSVLPCPCSLVFRCDNAKLATLLLVFTIPTAHDTTDSEFVLQYDGDNLLHTHVRLVTNNGHLKRPQLDKLAPLQGKGKQRLDIKTLQLSTMRLSPFWCPASTSIVSPRPGHESALQRLVDLAKATNLAVVFDFNQLHQRYHGSFKAFGKAAKELRGYPVESLLIDRGLKKASWEVFAPTEVAGAPPAYQGSPTRKRPRLEDSPPPLPPPRCWTPTTPPAQSFTTETTVAVTPEREAAALRDAQLQYHKSLIDPIVQDQVAGHIEEFKAWQAKAIDDAVNKRLDAYLGGPLHAERVDAAVDRQVDATVKARLSDTVQELLVPTDLPGSPATSFTYDDCGNRYPKLPPLTPAGKAFLPHLCTHLTDELKLSQQQILQRFEKQVSDAYNEVEVAAKDDRVREQGEWAEEQEDHAAEVLLQRRDTLHDLWQEGQKMLEQGRELCEELREEFGEEINKQMLVLVEAIGKLNRYSLTKLIAAEVAKLPEQQRKRKGIPKGFARKLLTPPNPKLLGRKMTEDSEGDDTEWEDN